VLSKCKRHCVSLTKKNISEISLTKNSHVANVPKFFKTFVIKVPDDGSDEP
jgi:hypothetical protein